MRRQHSLFEASRLPMGEAMALTVQSLTTYGAAYNHWAIAFSGGKDSSALTSMVLALLEAGQLPHPKTLTVLYSDTRQEIPPLHHAALQTLDAIRQRGYQARVVLPPLDERFFVYMLGRGVPPPKNRFRWCTPQLKIAPMIAALRNVQRQAGEKILMLTGVRIGESAARDQRIALSCSRDGAECGQGWFQESTPESIADTLAPLLHWRVCHVWDWLMTYGRRLIPSLAQVARVYGDDEAEEINARTGCIGCPLATQDKALDYVLSQDEWSYLVPLKRLRPLYHDLWAFKHRKRKLAEHNKSGQLSANPSRKGPLTLEARQWALEQVRNVQSTINTQAEALGRPLIDLLNPEEEARIRQLIALHTYPNKWSDADPDATALLPETYADGTTQMILSGLEVEPCAHAPKTA